MYNREAINILLWKAEMPCLNVWGVSQASQLCDRCHMSPELCTTIYMDCDITLTCDHHISNSAASGTVLGTVSTCSENTKSSTPASNNKTDKTALTSSQPSAQSKSSSKPKNPNANKLGKDGKLTPEERDRRFKLLLCLFCGLVGHKVPDCPHAKKSAKGKASTTEPASTNIKQAKE